jgi:hypothetical protein
MSLIESSDCIENNMTDITVKIVQQRINDLFLPGKRIGVV